jgi:hypothetical protein
MYKGTHMLAIAPISELWCILGHLTVYTSDEAIEKGIGSFKAFLVKLSG